MTSKLKFIGGILLIVGTTIGGGMLALPVATAQSSFLSTTVALIVCWLGMTISAFYILEVNLYLPEGSNMITMSAHTLGKSGQFITWIIYLALLYALLSAYIAGGSDVFQYLLQRCHINAPPRLTTTLYVLTFALIVYTGIRTVDYINSMLMYVKLFIYLLLLVLIMPHVSLANLSGGNWHYLKHAVMILITSYGYAIIVPSLRDYFNSDVQQLRRVIFIGSLFPLVCYIAWIAVITGVLPKYGSNGLVALMHNNHTTSGLGIAIEEAIHQKTITNLFRFFSSISMLTAFLGVALCLFDFLSDGLRLKKKGSEGLLTTFLVFVPPIVLVLFHPGVYILALQYAGIVCVALLLLLPALMVYAGRYHHRYASSFVTPGGKATVITVIIFACLLLVLGIYANI